VTDRSHPARPGKAAPTSLSLRDFEPLLPAEAIVLRAAESGDIAKLGYHRPRSRTPDGRIRAEFLGFLARGDGDAHAAGRRLQIVGAHIVGRIDLADATVPMSLWLYRCLLSAAPRLGGAHVRGSVTFGDCALPGLQAEACRIDGHLALNAGCDIEGEVLLARANIGRDLNCERMRMHASGQVEHKLVADGARIRGDVVLGGGFEAAGEVRFVGAHVGGDLRATSARMMAVIDASDARGVALNLDRLRVGGSVRLDSGFSAAGQVRLQQARIDGDLDCTGAAFDVVGDASWGHNNAAVLLDRARVGGSLILRRLQVPLQGASLADARVGTLVDDESTWGQHHVLDGFAYTRFAADAPTDAPTRLKWLGRQDATFLGRDFRPDPWRRLIKVLRRMGHGASARDVAVERERQMRRAGLIGNGAPPMLRWLVRLAHDLFGLIAGYGHRPLRLLALACALWLACGGLYWAASGQGALAPNALFALADPELAKCRPRCARLPDTLPAFQPFVYSAEALVPLVDLQQRRYWAPARHAFAPAVEEVIGVPLLRAMGWFEGLFGWIASLTLLAAATGLTDRDRRG